MKKLTKSEKLNIQLFLGMALVFFGVGLLTASFIVPPLGIIHSSILAAVGEVFTFAGCLIGIDYSYKYKFYEQHYKSRQYQDNEERDIPNDI